MLKLEFAPQPGRVLVSADLASVQPLQRLRSRYVSSSSISQTAFDMDLDDLLVNLSELAGWPASGGSVEWDTRLLKLVEGNYADSQILDERLRSRVSAESSPEPAEPSSWDAPLTDFQRRDVSRLLELSHGANFSVPGAGKTRSTLAVFHDRRESGQVNRLLVVAPKAAFESWLSEIAECYGPSAPSVAVMDTAVIPLSDVVLINYERLPDACGSLIGWLREQPALVVLDEAHRMKRGPSGAWGAACLALAPYAESRVILSGTPAPNGAQDLANVFSFVWPGQGRSRVLDALRDRDLGEASELLRPLFVRTTKQELDLPPVSLRIRRVELPSLHREIYDSLVGEVSDRWRGSEDEAAALGRVMLYLIMAATTPALLATGATPHEPLPYRLDPLRTEQGSDLFTLLGDLPHYEMSPKYGEALAIVAANAAAGRKTLIWSTFVRNLTSLHRMLKEFNPAMVHGGTADRAEELRKFREDSDSMVLLSNPATLGEGVSLHQVCNDAIYIDRDFAAGRFLQSLDRIHRLGLAPDAETNITVLVAGNTIDELVEQRLAVKLEFLGAVLDDPAVRQLADLQEEPTASAGMDAADLAAMAEYLSAESGS